MAVALSRENYVLHKLHSLSGIIPVGFYMLQHLTLNTFSLGGPDKFNGVVNFFDGMPKHFLLTLEICLIWTPLLFHAVYGLFIVNRAVPNNSNPKYASSQNNMFVLQRWTGIFIFFFLCFHVFTTTILAKAQGVETIQYAAWQANFSGGLGAARFALYLLGILACAYHLAYGIWNFCIRWGITISDAAQARVQKFSMGAFVVITLIGWSALAGFLIYHTEPPAPAPETVLPSTTSMQLR